MVKATPICFRLLKQSIARARSFAVLSAGSSRAARTEIMAMTTNNSIRVNPLCKGLDELNGLNKLKELNGLTRLIEHGERTGLQEKSPWFISRSLAIYTSKLSRTPPINATVTQSSPRFLLAL